MKTLIRAHVITAILGWVLAMVLADVLISDGDGLAAIAALGLVGVVTIITIVDILSVYFTKRQKVPFLPNISISFWSFVLIIYGMGLLAPNQPWQSRVIFAALIIIALFKIKVSSSLRQDKRTSRNDSIVS